MSPRQSLVMITDLDGTLLDEETYAFDAATEALRALRDRGVPLVLCSSKTRAEMGPLAAEVAPGWPYIVENGGAIVLPGGSEQVMERGVRQGALVAALAEIATETGIGLRGFSALGLEEVARVTGLPLMAAARACQREFDEPFLLPDARAEAVVRVAAEHRGLRVTRGGRFHHLTGPVDKGAAVREVLGLLGTHADTVTSVGLGDAPNDLPMLLATDRPILMPRRSGGVDPELASALPAAERAPEPGPAGWGRAVLAVLGGERLPGVEGPPP